MDLRRRMENRECINRRPMGLGKDLGKELGKELGMEL